MTVRVRNKSGFITPAVLEMEVSIWSNNIGLETKAQSFKINKTGASESYPLVEFKI